MKKFDMKKYLWLALPSMVNLAFAEAKHDSKPNKVKSAKEETAAAFQPGQATLDSCVYYSLLSNRDGSFYHTRFGLARKGEPVVNMMAMITNSPEIEATIDRTKSMQSASSEYIEEIFECCGLTDQDHLSANKRLKDLMDGKKPVSSKGSNLQDNCAGNACYVLEGLGGISAIPSMWNLEQSEIDEIMQDKKGEQEVAIMHSFLMQKVAEKSCRVLSSVDAEDFNKILSEFFASKPSLSQQFRAWTFQKLGDFNMSRDQKKKFEDALGTHNSKYRREFKKFAEGHYILAEDENQSNAVGILWELTDDKNAERFLKEFHREHQYNDYVGDMVESMYRRSSPEKAELILRFYRALPKDEVPGGVRFFLMEEGKGLHGEGKDSDEEGSETNISTYKLKLHYSDNKGKVPEVPGDLDVETLSVKNLKLVEIGEITPAIKNAPYPRALAELLMEDPNTQQRYIVKTWYKLNDKVDEDFTRLKPNKMYKMVTFDPPKSLRKLPLASAKNTNFREKVLFGGTLE